jgi:hypothetical protein
MIPAYIYASWSQGFLKHAVGMGSDAMNSMASFIKFGSAIQQFLWVMHGQHGDFRSLLLLQNTESKLKHERKNTKPYLIGTVWGEELYKHSGAFYHSSPLNNLLFESQEQFVIRLSLCINTRHFLIFVTLFSCQWINLLHAFFYFIFLISLLRFPCTYSFYHFPFSHHHSQFPSRSISDIIQCTNIILGASYSIVCHLSLY